MTDAKWLIRSPRLLVGDREGRLDRVVGIAARHDFERSSSTLSASQSGVVSVLPKHS
jgi:acetolactate synthase small subunit